jgi:hypothetical protein
MLDCCPAVPKEIGRGIAIFRTLEQLIAKAADNVPSQICRIRFTGLPSYSPNGRRPQ